MATVVASSHPLLADREVLRVPVESGETLWSYLARLGLPPERLTAGVWRNGVAVARDAWQRTFVSDGDFVAVRPVAAGDDSNPLQIVLTIAVAVAAAYTGGLASTALLGAGYSATTAAVGGALVSGLVSIAGSLLISALVPARTPGGNDGAQGSPTYSLSGARNRARAYQPMLVVLGTHRVVADIAAQPYTQYANAEQYFYGLYHFGLSNVSLSEFRIGNTPVDRYEEVELEVSNASGVVTGMYRNVDTLAGADLTLADDWIERTTSVDTHRIEIDIDAIVYRVDSSSGDIRPHELRLEGQYRPAGTLTWRNLFTSEVYVNLPWYWSLGRDEEIATTGGGSTFDYVEYDWDLDDPDLHNVGDTVADPPANGGPYAPGSWQYVQTGTTSNDEARALYAWRFNATGAAGGLPLPPQPTINPPTAGVVLTWTQRVPTAADVSRNPALRRLVTVPELVIGNSSTDPIRRTFAQVVKAGQYEVQIRRTSAESSTATTQDSARWSAMRSFQTETGDWYGQTRVGLRIRASGQLRDTVDEFNALAGARVETGDMAFSATPETAPLVVSSNPAYIFAHVARGRRDPTTGEVLFGAGLPDDQLDLEGLQRWRDWCIANDLNCDAVVDREITLYEVLTLIAQCGRAVPTWQTGKLGVVYDAADQPPVAVFGMANIIAGTFRVNYVAQNLADEIVAQFADSEQDYERRELRVRAPDVTSPEHSIDVEYTGVTRASQVTREASLAMARQAYHRRRITFETDLEGWVAEVGDVIQLSHDLTSWGYSGRAMALHDTAGALTGITLNRTVPIAAGTHYVTLRDGSGRRDTFEIATPAGDADRVDFVDNGGLWTLPGGLALDVVWLLDPDPTPGKLAKVVGVRPRNDGTLEVECIDELPEYYAYESNPSFVEPVPDYIGRTARVTSVRFTEQLLDRVGLTKVCVTLEALNTEAVLARYRLNGGTWVDQPLLSDLSFNITARTGDRIDVEAHPEPLVRLRGAWTERAGNVSATHTVVGRSLPPADVEGLRVEREERTGLFSWQAVPDVDLAYYEIRRGTSWADSEYIGRTLDTSYALHQAPAGQYLVRAVDTLALLSPNPAVVTLNDPPDANVVATRDEAALGWPCDRDNVAAVLGGVTLGAGTTMAAWATSTQPWSTFTSQWLSGALVRQPLSGADTTGTYTSCPLDVGQRTSFVFALDTATAVVPEARPWATNTTPWASQPTSTHSWFGADGDTGSVAYEMRFSDDATTWTAWEPYQSRRVTARYAQARALFEGSSDATPMAPLLTRFTLSADVPERRIVLDNVAVAPGGTTFALSPSFFSSPAISIAIQQGNVGDTYQVTAKTPDSVTVELRDAGGTSIGGLIDLIAIGF